MKNKIYFLLTAVLLLMILLPGCTAAEGMEAQADRLDNYAEHRFHAQPTPAASRLTEIQAQEIALNHVGMTADQVQYLHTEYEIDDRIPQFDVQFYAGNTEYEFEIHAETGEILSFDRD